MLVAMDLFVHNIMMLTVIIMGLLLFFDAIKLCQAASL